MNEGAPIRTLLERLRAIEMRSVLDGLHELGFGDLREPHVRALEALVEGGTVSDIAATLGIRKQSAAEVLGFLEAQRYVGSLPHPSDKRKRALRLTPKGRRASSAIAVVVHGIEERWADAAGSENVAALEATLVAILESEGSGRVTV